MKEKRKSTIKRFNPIEIDIRDMKYFNKRLKILENIRLLHANSHINQKSNILSILSYKSLKGFLRNKGFQFSDSQFEIARNKRKEGRISLNNYIRHIPYSKKRLSLETINCINEYMNKYSRVSSHEYGIKYLEKSKKEIFNLYIKDRNPKMCYSTFIKYIGKEYKKAKKRTDLCGICELSQNILKNNYSNLNKEDKKQYKITEEILKLHKHVVNNQRKEFEYLINNLNQDSCVLLMDFKENFKVSFKGDEVGYDFYNKRQFSCLGVCLLFNTNNVLTRHYLNIFSEVLTHDGLYSSDVLSKVVTHLKNQGFQNINLFTDCGPHFRNREFLFKASSLSNELKMKISVNFFGEHHGKTEVDGNFGRLSQVFKSINYNVEIENVHDLKEAFIKEYNNRNWGNVYFDVYERKNRPNLIKKLKFKGLKKIMTFLFIDGSNYYSHLTKVNNEYKKLDTKFETLIDTRETSFTPKASIKSRIKKYFNPNILKNLKARLI